MQGVNRKQMDYSFVYFQKAVALKKGYENNLTNITGDFKGWIINCNEYIENSGINKVYGGVYKFDAPAVKNE